MNQTSSFPANDEVLDVSVQHMLGQFSWTVPGKKKNSSAEFLAATSTLASLNAKPSEALGCI